MISTTARHASQLTWAVRAVSANSRPVNTIRAPESRTVLALAFGYLLVWALFGLFAYGAALVADRLVMGSGVSPWVGAVVIALCGLYQFTPFKQACLNHCRSPISFLLRFGNFRGRFRDVYVGFYHGGYCAGCCVGLMVIMVAVGVMNTRAHR